MAPALAQSLKIDLERNKARQYAAQLVHELFSAGLIAEACYREAECHLTELFHKQGVEITTKEQRHVEAIVR